MGRNVMVWFTCDALGCDIKSEELIRLIWVIGKGVGAGRERVAGVDRAVLPMGWSPYPKPGTRLTADYVVTKPGFDRRNIFCPSHADPDPPRERT